MVLGIIGKIGSGKSFCVNFIKENYNATIFSCDDIAKDLIQSKAINYEMGDPVEFFKSSELQETCRKIVHSVVFDKIKEKLDDVKSKIGDTIFSENLYIIESALPGPKLFDICDKTIFIDCSFDKSCELLSIGRNYSVAKTKLIFDSQAYYEKYYKMSDFKIVNDGNLDDLQKKIKGVLDEIYIVRK